MNDTMNNGCEVIGKTQPKSEPQTSPDIIQKKKSGIYGLKNKITNKWYVGQTINDIESRWGDYKRMNCAGQPELYRALKKYGYDNFEKVVLEECPPDRDILNKQETFWIKQKQSVKNGYNCNDGGASAIPPMLGKKHTEKTKQKIRIARANQKIGINHVSDEAKIRMSVARKNKPLTKEHRDKLSNSHFGIRHSEESKIKISNSLKGKSKGKWTEERRLRKSLSMVGIKQEWRKNNIYEEAQKDY